MPTTIRVRLSESPLDAPTLMTEVGRVDAGAVVVFAGTARDHSEGKTGITHLEYDAYLEHVEASLSMIAHDAADRWPLLSIVVEHRVGRVELGEASVVVAVSSAHRGDAFEGARFIIDTLKQVAPIWKREHWPGGAEWVEGA